MTGHGEKLTRKQEQAIAALMTAPSVTAAAKVAGVGESTLFRWLREPAFTEEYRTARREVVVQATSQLSQASVDAVTMLRGIMADIEAPASSRVTAAKAVLDYTFRGMELDDLAVRVADLEQAVRNEGS